MTAPVCIKCRAADAYVSPKTGHSLSYCRPCRNEYTREWHQRYGRRYRRYGVTREQVDAMRAAQDNRCPVCDDRFDEVAEHIDHCHSTGQVRGLLCGSCNQGLGNFKDSPARLIAAAKYLEDSSHI